MSTSGSSAAISSRGVSSSKSVTRVDRFERECHLGAFPLRDQRTSGSFHMANAGVGIQREDEEIAEGTCLFEQADVAGMQKVVAAVGEDHAPAFVLPLRTLIRSSARV